MRNRDFVRSAVLVVLGAGLIGFALGFPRWFEVWVWFPMWPNIGDAILIGLGGVVILYYALPREWKQR